MRGLILTLVAVSAVIGPALAQELVASRTLRAGTILQTGDFRPPEEDATAQLAERLIGLEVRRSIYAGHRIAAGDLGPPTLVRRNDLVTMSYRAGGLSIRADGRALSSGGVGERIRVMNLESRLTVGAVIAGPRLVEVIR